MNEEQVNKLIRLLLDSAEKCAEKGILESRIKLSIISELENRISLRDLRRVISDYKQAVTLTENALSYLITFHKENGTLEHDDRFLNISDKNVKLKKIGND